MINVSLKVNGYMLSGFDDLSVGLNLYSLSNLARLSFTEKDGDSLVQAKKIITANAEAMVYFDDKPVVGGYIYQPVPGFSDVGAGLEVIVTSPVAKYIGQAVKTGKIYYNQKISAILADLCPDIGLEIWSDKVLPKFVIYGFELVDRVIQKLCNKTDSVIYSGAYGQLVIDSRSEYAGTSGIVATGKNVLAIGRVENNDDAVVIAGQLPFDDNVSLDAAICTKISAAGSGKTRLYYGDDVSPAAVSALKFWSKRVPVSIPNWFDTAGNLLQLNNWYKATDTWHDLDGAMRLYALNFRLNNKNGYAADLFLEV